MSKKVEKIDTFWEHVDSIDMSGPWEASPASSADAF
jgi:hypothetical protein